MSNKFVDINMKFNIMLVMFILLSGCHSIAQENYNIRLIPEELKENANAVVRKYNTTVEIHALNNMSITQYKIITVLNRFGDQHVSAYEHYDDSRTIQKLSVLILDQNGEVIKKYKKSDFKDISAVSGGQMYTDNRVKHLEYYPTSYPYTVIFESKVREKSTAYINSWLPIRGYYIGVEESSYKLVNYTNTNYKFKGYNLGSYNLNFEENDSQLVFNASNLKAIKKESMSPDFLEVMPWVRVALNEFELKGRYGKCEDWKEFGLWQYEELLTERDIISESTKQKVSDLISNLVTEKEKVKRIYEYVQNNTRYVGVQLGIGGWQPILASEVDRVKYGDCKGLTNYTKALLKSQGIESYYTVVFSDKNKKNLDKSFASLQGNHVFLNVPVNEETVWLECPSQTAPFGFLGSSTDDRDVLVVKPTGGEIVHTPVYDETQNTYVATATISLKSNNSMIASFESVSKGIQYDYQSYKENLNSDRLEEQYMRTWRYLNGLKINDKKLSLDKENVVFNEKINLSVSNYTTKAGDKLFVPLNPLNRLIEVPTKYADRRLPFETERSFLDTDTYEFIVPDTYIIEYLPERYELSSEFGTYEIEIKKPVEGKIKYTRKLMLKEGVFPKEKYASYRAFIKKIVKKDKSKFVLTKKES